MKRRGRWCEGETNGESRRKRKEREREMEVFKCIYEQIFWSESFKLK